MRKEIGILTLALERKHFTNVVLVLLDFVNQSS